MKPSPPGARLGEYQHGDTVSEQTALHLVGLPDFADHWAILPSADGLTLALVWGDSCTLDELRRVNAWIRTQTAGVQADQLPNGTA
jgi:hypothetical protein